MVDPKDLVALVVDKKDKNFGRIASVVLHDWRESGEGVIRFSNDE